MAAADAQAGATDDVIDARMFTVGPVQENCYIVRQPNAATAVIVDPGDEADRIKHQAKQVRRRRRGGKVDPGGQQAVEQARLPRRILESIKAIDSADITSGSTRTVIPRLRRPGARSTQSI